MPPKEPKAIANWYDALSASYDKVYSDEQDNKHRKIIETLKDKEFEKFVDIGCGTGRLLASISSRTRLALGIDLSRQMLNRAKRRTEDRSTQFVHADASYLPLRDEIADGVVSVSVSENGPLFARQFLELSRIATENAVLSLTVFTNNNRRLDDRLLGERMELVASLSDREQLWTRSPNKG